PAIDDEDTLAPLTLQRQPVWVFTLAQRGRRFRRVGHYLLESRCDAPRDVLHDARLGDDDGLEKRNRNTQHLAGRLSDNIDKQLVACHEGQFAECAAWFKPCKEPSGPPIANN